MSNLRSLLVDELQDLLSAENQIVAALPQMVGAAHCNKLKENFQKHLAQTEGHVKRLELALQTLGERIDPKPCKGMKGLLEEGKETIQDGQEQDELAADLALIAAAQKVEHYEISGYGTARCLAKQVGEREVATLLSHTLGEEEAADFLLTDLSKPLLQQALSVEVGNGTKAPWGEPGDTSGRAIERSQPANEMRTAAPRVPERAQPANEMRTAASDSRSPAKSKKAKA